MHYIKLKTVKLLFFTIFTDLNFLLKKKYNKMLNILNESRRRYLLKRQ